MDNITFPSPTSLAAAELDQLRQALVNRYSAGESVLGAQLGAFIREHLTDPNLRRRFGGLKSFLIRHFPTEIRWQGKKGLDDMYSVHFGDLDTPVRDEGWRPVEAEASPWLWSMVTNPSTAVQFAWSPEGSSLLRAVAGTPSTEGTTVVEKISREDYQTIARNFVASINPDDASLYLQAIEGSESSVEFTNIMREEGRVSKWEEFRVDSAVRLFTERLTGAGADGDRAAQWANLLRSSQQLARSTRLNKPTGNPRVPESRSPSLQHSRTAAPETRAVAIKALEFLSESELSELRLPLGSVMQALRSLIING